jgi:hypothetical protein
MKKRFTSFTSWQIKWAISIGLLLLVHIVGLWADPVGQISTSIAHELDTYPTPEEVFREDNRDGDIETLARIINCLDDSPLPRCKPDSKAV